MPGVTLQNLASICTLAPPNRLALYVSPVNLTVKEFELGTPLRLSAFLAQVAHESGEFRYTEELASGDAYEGRADLGNVFPGDGRRYKGRGLIQLTGRANYKRVGEALGVDLEQNPHRAGDLDLSARVAGWFWHAYGLNDLADSGDFERITRRINGGLNGEESRLKYYHRALLVFGA